jgi:hypothetical protein
MLNYVICTPLCFTSHCRYCLIEMHTTFSCWMISLYGNANNNTAIMYVATHCALVSLWNSTLCVSLELVIPYEFQPDYTEEYVTFDTLIQQPHKCWNDPCGNIPVTNTALCSPIQYMSSLSESHLSTVKYCSGFLLFAECKPLHVWSSAEILVNS